MNEISNRSGEISHTRHRIFKADPVLASLVALVAVEFVTCSGSEERVFKRVDRRSRWA